MKMNLWDSGFCRYLFCCSYAHNVAPKGKYIAFVSAEAETDSPEDELKPGIELLGPIDEIFYHSYDTYVPTNKQEEDNCFISGVSENHSTSYYLISNFHLYFIFLMFLCFVLFYYKTYDATTHFESTVADVLEMYTKITGKVWTIITMFLGSEVNTKVWILSIFRTFFCRLLICLWIWVLRVLLQKLNSFSFVISFILFVPAGICLTKIKYINIFIF